MAVRAVIFDFDGVLADTEGEHLRAFQRVLAPIGVDLDERLYAERYLGYSDRDLIVALGRDLGRSWTGADISALVEAKQRGFAGSIGRGDLLYPSARACVTRLGAAWPLAIASGSLRDEIEPILKGGGLVDSFQVIVGAGDVARSKPAPDSYLEAARRLGFAASEAVAIEDSPWGLDAARAAGCRTIAVTHSCGSRPLTADVVVDSLADISPQLIQRLSAD
ncbi:MAG TPA: HAD family phosphatase [Vicinamibacterales bacterium]|nr:HAD family phosphatase [Vicinamibacterales bacterium]